MTRRPKYITDPDTFNKEFERVIEYRKELELAKKETQELIVKLQENSELPSDVEQNLENLKLELEKLQSLYNQTTTYIQAIEKYHDNFGEIKTEINDELEDALKQNEILKQYIATSKSLKDNLTKELLRSKTLLDDARQTLKVVTDSALSSVFIERSNDRKKSRRWWGYGVIVYFIIFVLALTLIIYNVAGGLNENNSLGSWVLKLAITAPFAYFLYFVTKQYSHERDLEEKYAFKALISQTISNNTKLLKDEFTGLDDDINSRKKILDFTIESLRSVYKEPFKELTFKSRLRLNPKNTDVNAEVEQSERS